jgi:hypothetical protein
VGKPSGAARICAVTLRAKTARPATRHLRAIGKKSCLLTINTGKSHAMNTMILSLVLLFQLALPGLAEVVVFHVRPAEAEKDYGIKITTQEFGPHQTGVTLEFKEDGELKDFTSVEMRIMQGDRSLVFATLHTKSANGVATARFGVDPAVLRDCQITIYQYAAPHGDVAYRMRVKDFVPAAGAKDSDSKPVSAKPAEAAPKGDR